MERDVATIKKDRLRYTKNKASANLAYLAIVFGVLYFVSIYQSDVGNYYYSITIGLSVVCNLVFLLITFLSSEGLKNYKLNYAFVIMAVGVVQIARIWGSPRMASEAITVIDGAEVAVMGDKQHTYVVICLLLSAVCCILAGVIGMYKTLTLQKYKKENGLV